MLVKGIDIMREIKDKILKFLSAQDVGAFSSAYATHSKVIAEVVEIDYETIKKIMKEMKKEGLVVYENKSYTVCEDYEMQEFSKFRNIGWLLTDKARETDIWKKENEKEKKIWEDINKEFEQELENKE